MYLVNGHVLVHQINELDSVAVSVPWLGSNYEVLNSEALFFPQIPQPYYSFVVWVRD